MILGLGSDMIDIRRIEKTLDRFGEKFIKRVFTDIEIAKSEGRAQRAASYAKRFAAKEAAAKALGTGIFRGVNWKEIGVVNLPSGKPTLRFIGKAEKRLAMMVPENFKPQISITITDDHPYAQAFVVISAVPKDWPDI